MIKTNPLFWLPQKSSFRSNSSFGHIRKFLIVFTSLALIFLSIGASLQVFAQTPQTYVAISGPQALIVGGSTRSYTLNVVDVTAPNGLGGFGFKLSYDKNFLSIADSNGDNIADTAAVNVGSFLGSTGKQVDCGDAYIDPTKNNVNLKKLNFACATIGDSPNGASGIGGVLANVKFTTGNTQGYTTLTLVSSELASNTANTYNIAHVKANWTLRVIKCADMTGDKFVAITDIYNLAQKFGWTPANPNWDPKYDIVDNNNYVTIQDIYWAAKEYGMTCP